MAFEYQLSKVVSISTELDSWGHKVLILQFKYVKFALTLDDLDKRNDLLDAIGGSKVQIPNAIPPKLPKFYKSE